MENIKTDIDKLFDKFTANTSYPVPKRLSFDFMDNSTETEAKATKKRKLSEDLNESVGSLNSSVASAPPSPWQARRMKADLLEANARIIQFKKIIDTQNTVRANMELEHSHKRSTLEKELKFNTIKAEDLEKHLKLIRNRESKQKIELQKLKKNLELQKQSYEDKLYQLNQKNAELDDNIRQLTNEMSNEISDLNRQNHELHQTLSITQEELDAQSIKNEEFSEKIKKLVDIENRFTKEHDARSLAEAKIKELEYQIGNYAEWENLSKVTQFRLSNQEELEIEVARLKNENSKIRSAIGNTLLLEEQVENLKNKLERYENNNVEASGLKVQVDALEEQVKEWEKVARDHCGSNTLHKPFVLRARIEHLLQKDLILASEKTTVRNEKHVSNDEIIELRTKTSMYAQQIEDYTRTLQNHKNFVLRLQKKLQFVVKERDLFKQLIENYEKDLTITSTSFIGNPDSQMKCRIEMLEKTLAGYKEMCAKLEEELKSVKTLPEMCIDANMTGDQYDRLRKDMEKLRIENEKLRMRKDELELDLERKMMNGDENGIGHRNKIIHFAMNPASEAYKEHENKVEKLQAEIERLRMRNRKLEEGNEELTVKLNDTNFTMNIKEVNHLRTQLSSLEAKNQHLKEIYKAASQEFREVCYMLFGYRVDRIGNMNYRVSSMYADSPEEYLNFRLNESGVLDMLETEYSDSLGEMMKTHLGTHNSLPAFLSALTLDLINKTTVVV